MSPACDSTHPRPWHLMKPDPHPRPHPDPVVPSSCRLHVPHSPLTRTTLCATIRVLPPVACACACGCACAYRCEWPWATRCLCSWYPPPLRWAPCTRAYSGAQTCAPLQSHPKFQAPPRPTPSCPPPAPPPWPALSVATRAGGRAGPQPRPGPSPGAEPCRRKPWGDAAATPCIQTVPRLYPGCSPV